MNSQGERISHRALLVSVLWYNDLRREMVMVAATSVTFPSAITLEPSAEYSEWMKQELQKSWETRKDPNRKRYSADEVWNKLGLEV